MKLSVEGTANRLTVNWNGAVWWLENTVDNVWELWRLNDVAPTKIITNNNKRRVLALALHRIINSGGDVPA